IPVDGRDLGLPDDVVDLTKRPDLVEAREIPRGSTGHGFPLLSRSSFNLERRDEALDRYSSSLVGGLPLDTRVEPWRIPVLERWTVQAHAYSTDVAGKVGLLGRLFGGEAKTARAGVVHEAKRFTIQRTEQDRITECGVAVRILAATTDWEAKVQLTLPNLAADAQLNGGDARVAIDVVGYSGPLGGLLPGPERLNVESLAAYLEAFHAVQAGVFSEAGLPFLTPTLLSYEDNLK